jgi:biotin-dependent carboxylase-like uncharacterized protein
VKALEVLQPGSLTTIQDKGRYGYQQYGVSVSGAMDKFALRTANVLTGNDDGEAALEITFMGPELKFLSDLKIALTGAEISPSVNGKPMPMWQSFDVTAGDELSFRAPVSGCRAYMALSGGIDIPLTMGSRSTHVVSKLGGLGRSLMKGDILRVNDISRSRFLPNPAYRFPSDRIPKYTEDWTVRVIAGPQADYFTHRGLETFYSSEYEITPQANRVGYRLKGPEIEHKTGPDIITDATPPGSVQIPGDGMPIVLLTDAQTTGGYAKIGVVISEDQDRLAQAKPGDRVKFQRISVITSQKLYDVNEATFQRIRREALVSR